MSADAACVSFVIDRVEGPVVVVETPARSVDLVEELLPITPQEGSTLWLCVAAAADWAPVARNAVAAPIEPPPSALASPPPFSAPRR